MATESGAGQLGDRLSAEDPTPNSKTPDDDDDNTSIDAKWRNRSSKGTQQSTEVFTQRRATRIAMQLAIGADHAGFQLKQQLVKELQRCNYGVLDVGTHDSQPADYPDMAEAVGLAVRAGRVDRGIVICGSGVGAAISANKLPGIRAGLCHDLYSAEQGVQHDNMNVLVLGARVIETKTAIELVRAFTQATFSGEERHLRRLDKVRALEARYGGVKTQ